MIKDVFKSILLTDCFGPDIYVARAVFEDRISRCFFITLHHKETKTNFERRNYENVQKRNFA
jgi:hypothetical protein